MFFLPFFMQLFSADTMIFSKKNIFSPENIKKRPQKLLTIGPKLFFHKYGLDAETSPELIFHIIKCREQVSVLLSVAKKQQSACIIVIGRKIFSW